jgi:hypothetical protein
MAKEWHKYVVEFVLRKLNLQKGNKTLYSTALCKKMFRHFSAIFSGHNEDIIHSTKQ